MKRMFDSKLDKLRKDLLNKIQSLRYGIYMDLSVETLRVDEIMTTIHSIQTRLNGVEQRIQTVRDDHTVMNKNHN